MTPTKRSSQRGYLVIDGGGIWEGRIWGGHNRAGEVVFNTSHQGYEEIATDPSYYHQIMILTAPMQGNYGSRHEWESKKIHIEGFVALEIQNSVRDSQWLDALVNVNVPVLTDIDTRAIVLEIRKIGTPWGAVVQAESPSEARALATDLITAKKKLDSDWPFQVCQRQTEVRAGAVSGGPRVAILDFGAKENILRELQSRCSEVALFSSRASAEAIRDWNPDGLMMTNGPGDPSLVVQSVKTVQELLGWKPIFGICMGNQILAQALGGKTYKMPFGHRGGNHPVRDLLLNEIYMTSQNHGYAVDEKSLPSEVKITHTNLYDGTVEGILSERLKCWSVQYHPENHPGPREAARLFDYFIDRLK